jgi:hypothetical protein
MYKYKMIQIPSNITVQMKAHKGNEAAAYMEQIVNKWAAEGWEFYRVDSVGVTLQPGCFGGSTGKNAENSVYHVITFRMPV